MSGLHHQASITITEDVDDVDDDVDDAELAKIHDESNMNFLEIKEIHPLLKREVTRHKFPGASGIDVVVMPATPRDSPVFGCKPNIIKKPHDLDLNIGEDAQFELVINDTADISVSWSKGGQPLFGSGRMKIWNKGNVFYFRISKVEVSDEALYECRVRNDYGEVLVDAQLLVNDGEEEFESDENDDDEEEEVAPNFIKKLKKQYTVIEGSKLELKVQVDGQPPPKVSWYYEGQKLISSEDIKLISAKNMHTLLIEEVLFDDEGHYRCTIHNEIGESSSETVVLVEE